MYAIMANGGKQYKVAEGDVVQLEKISAEIGQTVDFKEVIMISDGDDQTVGAPYVDGASVSGEVVDQARAKKVGILKFKRRKHHMKRMGHRQDFSQIKITEIKIQEESLLN